MLSTEQTICLSLKSIIAFFMIRHQTCNQCLLFAYIVDHGDRMDQLAVLRQNNRQWDTILNYHPSLHDFSFRNHAEPVLC